MRIRNCFAFLLLIPAALLAQGARLPPSPTPAPMTAFSGRYVDSTQSPAYHAYLVKAAPELDRAFAMLSATKLGIYKLSAFPQVKVPNGASYAPPDAQIDLTASGGWVLDPSNETQPIRDVAWDARGYIYIACANDGFGIADLQGRRVYQSATFKTGNFSPSTAMTFTMAGRTYAMFASQSIAMGGAQTKIFDVTDPAQPVRVAVDAPLDIRTTAKTLRGDAIIILAGTASNLQLYSPETLLSGGSPQLLATSAPVIDVATDGSSFYALEAHQIEQFSQTNGQWVRTAIPTPSTLPTMTYIGFGGGYLAVAGWNSSISGPAGALLRFNGAGFDATDVTAYFDSAYSGLRFVTAWDVQPFVTTSGTYVAFAFAGIGDVYSLAPSAWPGTMQVGTTALSISESAGGVDVPVVRTDGTAPVVVPYTISPATTAGVSAPASGSISFAANETSRAIHVPIANDTTYEGDRTFTLSLGTPSAGAILGSPTTTTITILEDDPVPAITIFDTSVLESNTNAAVTLSLSNASAFPVTVAYTSVDGTAKAGSDYVAASGTVTFAAGALQQSVSVPIRDDTLVEGTESFTIVLSNPQGATLGRSSAVVQIEDNDTDLQLTIGSPAKTVVTATPATFTFGVHNAGPGTAQNVRLAVPVPAGATLVSATASNGSCTGAATVVCTVATIASNADDRITIVVNAPSVHGSMALSATVTQDGTDPNPGNNSATAAVGVLAPEQIPTAGGITLLALALAIGALGVSRLR